MPHIRTTYGSFQKQVPNQSAYIDYIVKTCLPLRLIQIADNGNVNNMSVETLMAQNPTISIEYEGNEEGTPTKQYKHNTKYNFGLAESERKNLRVDKQHDYWLRLNGSRVVKYVTLQVQYASGQGAHGGVLIPFREGFPYNEIADALSDSCKWVGGQGYSVMYTGMVAPNHQDGVPQIDRDAATFEYFKARWAAINKENVVCMDSRCKAQKEPYQNTLTNKEWHRLMPLYKKAKTEPRFKPKKADGASLYCPHCKKNTLHLFAQD